VRRSMSNSAPGQVAIHQRVDRSCVEALLSLPDARYRTAQARLAYLPTVDRASDRPSDQGLHHWGQGWNVLSKFPHSRAMGQARPRSPSTSMDAESIPRRPDGHALGVRSRVLLPAKRIVTAHHFPVRRR
jgi:hypothetical protein